MTDNKIQQAFAKYNLELDDEQVKREVAALLAKHLEENNTINDEGESDESI